MEQYNGEPGALRGACPVLREDCANLPPKGGKAALSYSTPFSTHPSILPTGSSISTPSEDPPIKRKEFCMNPKYQKVLSDIEKAEKKKSEIEGQLKELYDKKTELENLEIINTVRSMVMDKDQIMAFLSSMKGGTKPAENTEVIDNA